MVADPQMSQADRTAHLALIDALQRGQPNIGQRETTNIEDRRGQTYTPGPTMSFWEHLKLQGQQGSDALDRAREWNAVPPNKQDAYFNSGLGDIARTMPGSSAPPPDLSLLIQYLRSK